MDNFPCYMIMNTAILHDVPENDLSTALGLYFATEDREYTKNVDDVVWLIGKFFPEVELLTGKARVTDDVRFNLAQIKGPRGTVCSLHDTSLAMATAKAIGSISAIF